MIIDLYPAEAGSAPVPELAVQTDSVLRQPGQVGRLGLRRGKGSPMRNVYDVCVFGSGPAGAAVATRLAALGLSTVMLDRPPQTRPWGGESLSGAIREPLSTLGLWEQFRSAGHVAGYEQRVAWGGAPWSASSLFASHGHLWHVDRARFDADLRAAVQYRGVPIHTYRRLEALQREGYEWRIACNQGAEFCAGYLVDATGRSRAVARRLGARPRTYDRLIAFTAVLARNPHPEFAHAMLLESTPQGWWYAAPVPQGHVLAFFTDADLRPQERVGGMRIVAANSAFAQAGTEEGWVTVGDACAAHDPLCGWGVCRAMSNGILAAEAIGRYVRTADASWLAGYRRHCQLQFDDYLTGLTEHYSYEQRWRSFPFWERRLAMVQEAHLHEA